MKILTLILIISTAMLSACADPAANKPKAVVAGPAANQNSSSPAAAPASDLFSGFTAKGTELNIDPARSKIEFTGSKVTGKHDGGFKTFKGVIDLVGDKAEGSRVLFEIDMSSVFTDADGLTKHLQTGDFFEVAKFPTASFVSTKVAADTASGKDNYTVTGDLQIRGVTKSITFPAKIVLSPGDAAVESEFTINRKDFGIVYAGKADDLIRDDVVLRLTLMAPRKAQ